MQAPPPWLPDWAGCHSSPPSLVIDDIIVMQKHAGHLLQFSPYFLKAQQVLNPDACPHTNLWHGTQTERPEHVSVVASKAVPVLRGLRYWGLPQAMPILTRRPFHSRASLPPTLFSWSYTSAHMGHSSTTSGQAISSSCFWMTAAQRTADSRSLQASSKALTKSEKLMRMRQSHALSWCWPAAQLRRQSSWAREVAFAHAAQMQWNGNVLAGGGLGEALKAYWKARVNLPGSGSLHS